MGAGRGDAATAQPDLVARLADGTTLASLAFSEPGSRSHFWALISQAEHNVTGIRLNARKSWVTSAEYADVYLALTLTPGADTIDVFALPATAAGVAVTGQWRGLGLRGNTSAPVLF